MARRYRASAAGARFRRRRLKIAAAAILLALAGACGSARNPRLKEMPDRMLWAWERPEDLRFADPETYGVAFLAQTVFLEDDDVRRKARRQPLDLAPGTYVVAVTRIETSKDRNKRPDLGDDQVRRTADLIAKTKELPGVRAVQVDFDAVVTERPFYRKLLGAIRASLPAEMPLSMTSLASWCMGDRWFRDLPVDEVVPMAFDMGKDDKTIRGFLNSGNDWKEPKCRESYGLMLGDELAGSVDGGRRIYFFKESSWKSSDLKKIEP